jgi:hypothetical protein
LEAVPETLQRAKPRRTVKRGTKGDDPEEPGLGSASSTSSSPSSATSSGSSSSDEGEKSDTPEEGDADAGSEEEASSEEEDSSGEPEGTPLEWFFQAEEVSRFHVRACTTAEGFPRPLCRTVAFRRPAEMEGETFEDAMSWMSSSHGRFWCSECRKRSRPLRRAEKAARES